MKDQKFPHVKKLFIFFLSFFGVGLLPFAPGTWGSLATLPILYLLGKYQVPIFFFLPLTLIVTIVASFMVEMYQKRYQIHDPPWVVIDEVLGMLVAWFFWPTHSPLDLFLTFLLFRLFDIWKIWPANFIDKNIKHGAGTILDDLVSGIYAGCLHWLLQKFILIPYGISDFLKLVNAH